MSLYDENAEILRQMERQGADLRPSRVVDFSHMFPDRASAEKFAGLARMDGFDVAIEEIEREGYRFDVTASLDMEPTCRNITDNEERLGKLALSCSGHADGWGFFRS